MMKRDAKLVQRQPAEICRLMRKLIKQFQLAGFEIRPRWQAPLHIAKLTRRAIALTAKAVRLRHFREGSLPPGLMLARRASYELVENVPPIAPKGGIRNNL